VDGVRFSSEVVVHSHKHFQVAKISVALLDTAAQHFFVCVHIVVLLLLGDALLYQQAKLIFQFKHL
jgi:hypothetical protein